MSLARELSGPGRAGESGEVEPSRMMPARETERMMKLQDVILKAMAKKITWIEAAEIAGMSVRNMQRMRARYQEHGYNGLFDQRRGKRSIHRVPMETAEKVLALYRDKYPDFNVRHFHEKLQEEEDIQLSYSWVKQALQGAGLVAKRRRARSASATSAAAADARHAVAHRRQQTPLVPGRPLLRSDRDSGRRHQRDLLCATGGGRVDADGDARRARSDRAQGTVLRPI